MPKDAKSSGRKVVMARLNAMAHAVKEQKRRNQDLMNRLELVIDERKQISRIAAERVADALILKWEVRDGVRNAEQALAEIEQWDHTI